MGEQNETTNNGNMRLAIRNSYELVWKSMLQFGLPLTVMTVMLLFFVWRGDTVYKELFAQHEQLNVFIREKMSANITEDILTRRQVIQAVENSNAIGKDEIREMESSNRTREELANQIRASNDLLRTTAASLDEWKKAFREIYRDNQDFREHINRKPDKSDQ